MAILSWRLSWRTSYHTSGIRTINVTEDSLAEIEKDDCLTQEYRCLASIMDISKGPFRLWNSFLHSRCLRSFLRPNHHNSTSSSFQSCFVTAILVWFLIALSNKQFAWKSLFGGAQPMTVMQTSSSISTMESSIKSTLSSNAVI